MPLHQFTDNAEWNAGVEARSDVGYRTLAYDGDLGGGTLRVWTQAEGTAKTPVPDTKLSAATVDGASDVIKQLTFRSSGNVFVHLTGATAPDVTVTVL
jgi:hypothetical protein